MNVSWNIFYRIISSFSITSLDKDSGNLTVNFINNDPFCPSLSIPIFGITLSVVSVVAVDYFTNRISAAILLLTILFYVFVYTIWLKRRTPQNIVIGGAAGAFPPVIGWTISTGSLSLEPLAFFLIIFFWTPSHFWALSLYKSDDYKKAKLPMLPLTNGVESTKLNIFIYSLLMLHVIDFQFFSRQPKIELNFIFCKNFKFLKI